MGISFKEFGTNGPEFHDAANPNKVYFKINNMTKKIEIGSSISIENVLSVDGSVGVGVESPINKLEVDGGAASTRLRISTTNTSAQAAGIILSNSSKTAFNDGVVIAHGEGYARFGDLSGKEIMRLVPVSGTVGNVFFPGNVGIGKDTPSYKVDVSGGLRCSAGFGCNTKSPQSSVSVNAASVSLSGVVALCNQLRGALISNGICS